MGVVDEGDFCGDVIWCDKCAVMGMEDDAVRQARDRHE